MLAFLTISHSGAMLLGISTLKPDGYAGAAHYLLGHACIKSGLFLCAGMLLHRLQSVDELKLHGRAKGLPLCRLLMAALALLLAGAPLSALSEGGELIKHGLEHRKSSRCLRCTSRPSSRARRCSAPAGASSLGLGPREPDAPGPDSADEEPETEPAPISSTMWVPAVALLVAAIATTWVKPQPAIAARMLNAGFVGEAGCSTNLPAEMKTAAARGARPPRRRPPRRERLPRRPRAKSCPAFFPLWPRLRSRA